MIEMYNLWPARALQEQVLRIGALIGYPPIHCEHGYLSEQGEESWTFFVGHSTAALLREVLHKAETYMPPRDDSSC